MEVILIKDIEQLGKSGDQLKVKDGYARNFLIPKNLALEATPHNLNIIQQKKESKSAKEKNEKMKAIELAEKLSAISCTISMPSGEDDKLFGSVTNGHIAEALEKAEGIVIDKKKITIPSPINKLGVYTVFVKLHPEVSRKIKVWVIKE